MSNSRPLKVLVEQNINTLVNHNTSFIAKQLSNYVGTFSQFMESELRKEVRCVSSNLSGSDKESNLIITCFEEAVKLNFQHLATEEDSAKRLSTIQDSADLLLRQLTQLPWKCLHHSSSLKGITKLSNLTDSPVLEADTEEQYLNTVHWFNKASKSGIMLLTQKQESNFLTSYLVEGNDNVINYICDYYNSLSPSQFSQLLSIRALGMCSARRI